MDNKHSAFGIRIIIDQNVSAIIYNNTDTSKSQILKDNFDRTGIYQWTHIESGKIYIGSAVDLSIRLKYYYSTAALKREDNIICRAILRYTHSAFSLAILEYINIRLYIPVCGMLILLSIHSFRSNNNIGDIGLGSYNALKVQKGVIDFLTNEEAQNKQISTGSFQQKVNMQNAASGFISNTQESFHNIQWEIDSLSDYVIFDNIEPDSRYETIKNDSHYTMVYQIKKGNVWGAVFTKALH